MEATMLRSFCAAANVRHIVERVDCPELIKEAQPILDLCFGNNKRGTLMTDLRTLLVNSSPPPVILTAAQVPWSKLTTLDNDLYSAFQSMVTSDLPSTPFNGLLERYITVRGLEYAIHSASTAASHVFFLPDGSNLEVPGVIESIVTIPTRLDRGKFTMRSFFAVRPYPSLLPSQPDPFSDYPDFGASLWPKGWESQKLQIISIERPIHHLMRRDWDEHTYVVKSLNKVSHCYC
jgi:hypothetical protein